MAKEVSLLHGSAFRVVLIPWKQNRLVPHFFYHYFPGFRKRKGGVFSVYQALYRKYRPVRFEQVVGQEQVTQTLKNEIASGRIGHAFLFTGSRGTGKTTCSKIIAKAVNCPHQSGGDPCGVCPICKGIDDGSILDVVEIDAASNNGVDDIRTLREEAAFTPSVVKYRVYIIDEAHMLSTAAFNALLKIMEEPPEHVIFILATTEVHKVPATILSRCQRFDFKRIAPQVIKKQLLHVSEMEGIDLNEDAAGLIARLAEGGMRDALSLLDVCRSAASTVTADVVAQSAGLAVQDCLYQVADAVLARDIPTVLQVMEDMHEASVDYEKMCAQLISHYRGLMMTQTLEHPEDVVPGLPQETNRLKEQAQRYSMTQILYCLTVLQDTLSRMNKTTQPRTELEMAVIRMTRPEMDQSVSSIIVRLERLEKAMSRGTLLTSAPSEKQETVSKEPAAKGSEAPAKPEPVRREELPPVIQKETVELFEPWPQVLEQLFHTNKALSSALTEAKAYLYKELVLIDCQNPFFLELIRSNDFAKQSLHEALHAATGRDWRIGPYRPDRYTTEKNKQDPMEQMLDLASKEDIELHVD